MHSQPTMTAAQMDEYLKLMWQYRKNPKQCNNKATLTTWVRANHQWCQNWVAFIGDDYRLYWRQTMGGHATALKFLAQQSVTISCLH